MALVVKDLPTNAGDLRDAGSILGLEQSPGGAHGNPLQYSYLENPMDREAWRGGSYPEDPPSATPTLASLSLFFFPFIPLVNTDAT